MRRALCRRRAIPCMTKHSALGGHALGQQVKRIHASVGAREPTVLSRAWMEHRLQDLDVKRKEAAAKEQDVLQAKANVRYYEGMRFVNASAISFHAMMALHGVVARDAIAAQQPLAVAGLLCVCIGTSYACLARASDQLVLQYRPALMAAEHSLQVSLANVERLEQEVDKFELQPKKSNGEQWGDRGDPQELRY